MLYRSSGERDLGIANDFPDHFAGVGRAKAAEGSRTPRPVGDSRDSRNARSVVECGCPLPLLYRCGCPRLLIAPTQTSMLAALPSEDVPAGRATPPHCCAHCLKNLTIRS